MNFRKKSGIGLSFAILVATMFAAPQLIGRPALSMAPASLLQGSNGWTHSDPIVHLSDSTDHVGIGTATPDSSSHLDVRGQFFVSGATTGSGYLGFFVQGNKDASGVTTIGASSGGGQNRGPLAIMTGDTNQIFVEVDGDIGIGTSTPASKLDVNGGTRTKCLTITGGCDLSEPFEVTEPSIEPGMVVSIDPAHEGKLRLARTAYDTTVAGVLSGAGGVKTGMVLSQSEVFEAGKLVALTGRVYVWCDASFGEIKPGDLLTTSTTPGHAMKVADRAQANGAILGKALSSLSQGKGLVLIVVTLQ